MAQDHDRSFILFDGDCGICQRVIRFFKRRDQARAFDFIDFRSLTEDQLLALGTTQQDCALELQAIRPDGSRVSGAVAMNFIIETLYPAVGRLIALTVALPFALRIESAAYRYFARHRRRVSLLFGFRQCSID